MDSAIELIKLSEHFTVADLTKTNRGEFQKQNRNLSEVQIQTLRNLAGLLEVVWTILGVPVIVESGYRCPALNAAVGSTDRSQHLKCEAADMTFKGMEIEGAFRILWKEVRDARLNVGQLIFETAERLYGVTSWVHISLGAPWRDEAKCNQILRMEQGKYSLLK
jgi:hypothetical protein